MTIMSIDNYVEAIHEAPLHSRKSIRLKGYDYSQTGAYFVTICAHNREILFGMVGNDKSQLNKFGQIVETEWLITAQIRENIELDEYAIMPNHFHGILLITDNGMGTALRAHTIEQFGKPVSGSLPTIIHSFKSTVTKQINQLRNTPGSSVWQRNYYEHIIRNEDGLNRIR
jgi:REP element-mobilizing transposase RayT